MTTLQFADTHNMVAFLSKPAESEGFEQIVDFLNANPIRYALMINPAIYTSCIEQFWATAKVKTVNGEVQLQALVDRKKIIVTEASVRRDLQLNDEEGTDCLPNATIFEELTRMGKPTRKDTEVPQPSGPTDNVADEAIYEEMDDSLERAATTATSLDAEQDRGNINKTQSKATLNEPSSLGTSSSSGPRRQETMGDTITQTRFENVSKTSTDLLLAVVNTPQSDEDSLKLKNNKNNVPTLLSIVYWICRKLRPSQALGDYKFEKDGQETREEKREDASKERRIADIDDDAGINLSVLDDEEVFVGQDMDEKEINVAEKEVSTADPVTTAGEVVTTASPTETTTADDLTLAQTLIEIRSAKSKVKGVVIGEQSESTTRTRPQQLPSKDKGKGIMEEPEKPTKKKDQIRHDEEVAQRLQAQMQAELEEEDRLVRQREEEANIVSWDNVQAMIDADYQMAQQMQAEEQEKLSIEEKSKLFVQLLEARKKHFAAIRAKEKRNKPPTKAQKRNTMSTYLKNMAGYKHNQLKNKSFDDIQKLFDKAMKRVNTFVDMDAELVEGSEVRAEGSETRAEGSSKRAGEELEQESSKKQKLEEDKESEELKQCLEIISDDGDDVTIDATPLSTKSPTIVDYKIYKEGKKSYFQIIKADGNSQMYLTFGKMLKNFNREDLEVLWSIVKARFKKTEPVNYMDNFLIFNLKTMFEHDVEDSVWKNQQGLVKVLN
ncbi:hypothetical protein Tco_0745320 [Tanacetum coccineum]